MIPAKKCSAFAEADKLFLDKRLVLRDKKTDSRKNPGTSL